MQLHPSEVGTSPSFALSGIAWTRCLGKWHITAICRNDMTLILCLLGICENKYDDDEVLMGTAVTGPNKALQTGRLEGAGSKAWKETFFFFGKQLKFEYRKFVPTQRD